MSDNLANTEQESTLHTLRNLEQRIARLESRLGLPAAGMESAREATFPDLTGGDKTELEMKIGEFCLPWAGGIVFLLGIAFLMTYTLNQGHSLLSAVIGYCAGAGLYVLARAWQQPFPYLARLLVCASLLLSYYTTLRLHYFTQIPLLESQLTALLLLLLVVALQLFLAVVRQSQLLAALAVFLGLLSALLSDATHIMLMLTVLLCAYAAERALRRGWWRLLNLTIVLVYLAHGVWLINDPIAGHPPGAIGAGQYPLAYLFVCAAVLAWPALFYDPEASEDVARASAIFLNGMGFSGAISLAAIIVYPGTWATVYLAAFGLLLLCSIAQWLTTHQHFAPSVFACFSYLSLTIAIYGLARVPEAFLWLGLQSFLVVSMALWFRSRVLVFANAVIYFSILIAYWITSPRSDLVNFGFALVALGSARVMNWQKERLTLRTDGLRNVYLAISFILILYSLHHLMPSSYVALSWTASAAAYFLLSLLLRNIKYRWMSLLNLAATVVYLFLVDLPHLDPKFRVAAFLLLGLMAVALSLFYTRLRRPARRSGS